MIEFLYKSLSRKNLTANVRILVLFTIKLFEFRFKFTRWALICCDTTIRNASYCTIQPGEISAYFTQGKAYFWNTIVIKSTGSANQTKSMFPYIWPRLLLHYFHKVICKMLCVGTTAILRIHRVQFCYSFSYTSQNARGEL